MVDAYAQIEIGEEYLFQEGEKAGEVFTDLGSLISQWLPNVYVVAGLILFFFVLLGGFNIITSAGNKEKLSEGGKTLESAVIGFVILFASYWIIQIIQVVTGIPILVSEL
jgi:uncharacterized membrane protein